MGEVKEIKVKMEVQPESGSFGEALTIGDKLAAALGVVNGQTGYLSWRPVEKLVVPIHGRNHEGYNFWQCPKCKYVYLYHRPHGCNGCKPGVKFHPTMTLEFADLLANVQTEVEA